MRLLLEGEFELLVELWPFIPEENIGFSLSKAKGRLIARTLLWFREKISEERKRRGEDSPDRKRKGKYRRFVRRELWQKESDLVELQ